MPARGQRLQRAARRVRYLEPISGRPQDVGLRIQERRAVLRQAVLWQRGGARAGAVVRASDSCKLVSHGLG